MQDDVAGCFDFHADMAEKLDKRQYSPVDVGMARIQMQCATRTNRRGGSYHSVELSSPDGGGALKYSCDGNLYYQQCMLYVLICMSLQFRVFGKGLQ